MNLLSMKGVVEDKMIKVDKLSSSVDEQLVTVANDITEK